jgi:hypothetical protein
MTTSQLQARLMDAVLRELTSQGYELARPGLRQGPDGEVFCDTRHADGHEVRVSVDCSLLTADRQRRCCGHHQEGG